MPTSRSEARSRSGADVGTVEKLGSLTPEELQQLPGVGEEAIQSLYTAINGFYSQFEAQVEASEEESTGEAVVDVEAAVADEAVEVEAVADVAVADLPLESEAIDSEVIAAPEADAASPEAVNSGAASETPASEAPVVIVADPGTV